MAKTHLEHPSQATACGTIATQTGVDIPTFRSSTNQCKSCARVLAAIEAGRPAFSGVVSGPDFDFPCHLCSLGFPIVDGYHVGTQALGMIPSTPCKRKLA